MSAMTAKISQPVETKDTPITHEEICAALNVGFVNQFKLMGLPTDILKEFVFSLDHLDELSRTASFPNNRILNTPDVMDCGTVAAHVFNDFAKRCQDLSQYGCSVSDVTMESIKVFLDYKYITNIYAILKDIPGNGVTVTLDGNPFAVKINRYSPHPEFGILRYENLKTTEVILLPFHLSRILDA